MGRPLSSIGEKSIEGGVAYIGRGEIGIEGEIPPEVEEYKLGGGILVRLPKEGMKEAWEKAKKALDILIGVSE